MTIKNLELIRARNANRFALQVKEGKAQATGKEGGDAMKKIPAMVMANGLLASLAFAIEEKKSKDSGEMEPRSKGHRAIFDAITTHLHSDDIDIIPKEVTDAPALLNYLVEQDSATLKLATDETLAWLGYARRFVTPPEETTDNSQEDTP